MFACFSLKNFSKNKKTNDKNKKKKKDYEPPTDTIPEEEIPPPAKAVDATGEEDEGDGGEDGAGNNCFLQIIFFYSLYILCFEIILWNTTIYKENNIHFKANTKRHYEIVCM